MGWGWGGTVAVRSTGTGSRHLDTSTGSSSAVTAPLATFTLDEENVYLSKAQNIYCRIRPHLLSEEYSEFICHHNCLIDN